MKKIRCQCDGIKVGSFNKGNIMDNKLRITRWLNPTSIGGMKLNGVNKKGEPKFVHTKDTKYGVVDNHTWLIKEKERIEGLGEKCKIVLNNGLEALFYVGFFLGREILR